MANIALLVPREYMAEQAKELLAKTRLHITEIKVISTIDAINDAKESIKNGANIIIARGYQASLIRRFTHIPVVEIMMTGQEMMLLISKVKQMLSLPRPTIGIVGFDNMICNMKSFPEVFGVTIKEYYAKNSDELQAAINSAIHDHVDCIIGGDTANSAAELAGIPSLFLNSTADSMMEAFRVAERVEYAMDIEKKNAAQLSTLLAYSFNGILKLDQNGVILASNHIIDEIVGCDSSQILGKHISSILPSVDGVDKVLRDGQELYSVFQRINHTEVVMNIAPIIIDEHIDGAILSCHEIKKIEETEAAIRRELYQQGHVAKENFEQLLAESPSIKPVIDTAKMFPLSDTPVLIYGESGTEKDKVAECIHNASLRKNEPFIKINCTSMTPEQQLSILFDGTPSGHSEHIDGLVYAANHGSLLIQDIDNLCLNAQYRLFQVIKSKIITSNQNGQSSAVNTRILATSKNNLYSLMQQGTIREDFYYAVCALSIEIPPLRDRKDDIDRYIDKYTKKYCDKYSRYLKLTAGAKQILHDYNWPGNLNQLESFCERIVLTTEHRLINESVVNEMIFKLYPILRKESATGKVIVFKDPEAVMITDFLKKYDGNRASVASALKISKATLWRKMKKYGITNNY